MLVIFYGWMHIGSYTWTDVCLKEYDPTTLKSLVKNLLKAN